MATRRTPLTDAQKKKILDELHRDTSARKTGYREKALKLYPHLCASCGREFSGKRLKELTVHHKDHNHDNNPPDGSNWELLCIYCHDHEHEKLLDAKHRTAGSTPTDLSNAPGLANPFDSLNSLI
ncbi:MAG: YajD family HNH nuclease [Kiritimatiellae bacterium]|nr:YajD family HNH nuclease [Kiritimatiellia bacterium]